VAYEKLKTEHAGAKNGGGAWVTRAEAKAASKHRRRVADAVAITAGFESTAAGCRARSRKS
jgi:hypothetical protein